MLGADHTLWRCFAPRHNRSRPLRDLRKIRRFHMLPRSLYHPFALQYPFSSFPKPCSADQAPTLSTMSLLYIGRTPASCWAANATCHINIPIRRIAATTAIFLCFGLRRTIRLYTFDSHGSCMTRDQLPWHNTLRRRPDPSRVICPLRSSFSPLSLLEGTNPRYAPTCRRFENRLKSPISVRNTIAVKSPVLLFSTSARTASLYRVFSERVTTSLFKMRISLSSASICRVTWPTLKPAF